MQGVSSETLSAFKFPVNREKYREYRHFSAYFCVNVPIRLAIIYSIQESWRDCIIDAMNECSIAEQGIPSVIGAVNRGKSQECRHDYAPNGSHNRRRSCPRNAGYPDPQSVLLLKRVTCPRFPHGDLTTYLTRGRTCKSAQTISGPQSLSESC